ncbi:MAG UNVERIFIED_CONTAM: methyltransferase domain-containing protein [Microcystis novacekii LVE1205-3]|jgi:SAM-dependent methyltransferase
MAIGKKFASILIPSVNPDILGTITDLSAVPDSSVDAVFSSHNLEHIYHYEVPIALGEFKRILKPEGFLMIVVPDMQTAAEFVARGDMENEPLYISPGGTGAGFMDVLRHGNRSPWDALYGS